MSRRKGPGNPRGDESRCWWPDRCQPQIWQLRQPLRVRQLFASRLFAPGATDRSVPGLGNNRTFLVVRNRNLSAVLRQPASSRSLPSAHRARSFAAEGRGWRDSGDSREQKADHPRSVARVPAWATSPLIGQNVADTVHGASPKKPRPAVVRGDPGEPVRHAGRVSTPISDSPRGSTQRFAQGLNAA